MERFIQISRLLVVFGCLFSHHMHSVQQTTDTYEDQDQADFQKMILEQRHLNYMQTTFISLVSSRTRKLEDNFKNVSNRIENIEDSAIKFQNLTSQLDDIGITVQRLNNKIDKIEKDLKNGTEKLTHLGKEWKHFDGVYYFFSREVESWEAAKVKCEAMNSETTLTTLVTIRSQQINDFLILNGNNSAYWTGGNDRRREKQWVWEETGDTFTYTNWRPSEPNDYGGKEDCLILYTEEIHTKHWNDLRCGLLRQYICQTSIPPIE